MFPIVTYSSWNIRICRAQLFKVEISETLCVHCSVMNQDCLGELLTLTLVCERDRTDTIDLDEIAKDDYIITRIICRAAKSYSKRRWYIT